MHFLAGLFLLACFAAQCLYVASHAPLSEEEIRYASPGPQYAGREFSKPPDPYHSPLGYYIAQFPVRHGTVPWFDFIGPLYQYRWLLRLAFVIFGTLLGGSLWYVARRLYGDIAGTFALAVYCFSPNIVNASSHISPDILAAWGFFGAVFLSIASAHTLYATPETLPWHIRWRRPVLAGVALGIGVGADFSTWTAAPFTLAVLLYLVPRRRKEAAAMWVASVVIATAILLMIYRFDASSLWLEFRTALAYTRPFAALSARHETLRENIHHANVFLFATVVLALAGWAALRRVRWFGNTASLIAAVVAVLGARFLNPNGSPVSLPAWTPAVPLLCMFAAGVFADLAETRARKLVFGAAALLVAGQIVSNLAQVAHMSR
jgi:hypothetical protein